MELTSMPTIITRLDKTDTTSGNTDSASPTLGAGAYDGEASMFKAARSSSGACQASQRHIKTEQKRRDRINEGFVALQQLLPGKERVEKAVMLTHAADYIRQMQGVMQQGPQYGLHLSEPMTQRAPEHPSLGTTLTQGHVVGSEPGAGGGGGMLIADPHTLSQLQALVQQQQQQAAQGWQNANTLLQAMQMHQQLQQQQQAAASNPMGISPQMLQQLAAAPPPNSSFAPAATSAFSSLTFPTSTSAFSAPTSSPLSGLHQLMEAANASDEEKDGRFDTRSAKRARCYAAGLPRVAKAGILV
ncbi:hypothetical protein WJX73_008575 [Symbiochloris irregularis]|uniref:BHLH domain-containing protein n=1 Tax=Symbiochloris irregularis TaxID=706552 RepID=A0AAW1NWD6_9CHLO